MEKLRSSSAEKTLQECEMRNEIWNREELGFQPPSMKARKHCERKIGRVVFGEREKVTSEKLKLKLQWNGNEMKGVGNLFEKELGMKVKWEWNAHQMKSLDRV